MAQDFHAILQRVASDLRLLGDDAILSRSVTGVGAGLTAYTDTGLATITNDQRLIGRKVYPWTGPNAEQERLIYSAQGFVGEFFVNPAFDNAATTDTQYYVFRDFSYSDWLDFANSTCRSLMYEGQVRLRGVTDLVQYTLPTPISDYNQIHAVHIEKFPQRWSQNYTDHDIQWYDVGRRNPAGDLYMALRHAVTASAQFVFDIRAPFLQPHMSAFTMTRSALIPFGETTEAAMNLDWLVSGMVWRALDQKLGSLSGQALELWTRRWEQASRRHAHNCKRLGVARVGLRLGYTEGREYP